MTTVIDGDPRTPAPAPRPEPVPVEAPAPAQAAPPWSVDTAGPADLPALADLFAACSAESVRLRFFGPRHEWPRDYLAQAVAGQPDRHDAVVAYGPGGRSQLLGLAGLAMPSAAPGADGRGTDRPDGEAAVAELGVLVADAWQRQGLGTAMISVLLARARERGIERVAASVLPDRSGLLSALGRHLERVGGLRTTDTLTAVYGLARPVERMAPFM